MSSATMASQRPNGIFDVGNILGNVADSAFSTFEEVFPVWVNKELDINPINDSPTFQETQTQRVRSGENLTSGDSSFQSPERSFNLSMNEILLGGGILLLGFMLFNSQ